MWPAKIIPALFSALLWQAILPPAHVVDVVEVTTLVVQVTRVYSTITVTQTVGSKSQLIVFIALVMILTKWLIQPLPPPSIMRFL